jgi:mycothiol system anti-sigma-R factor
MADCDETLRELYRFLDGELAPEAHHNISHHLDGCMDCLQVYDFQAELRMVIAHRAKETEVPSGLLERIKACFGDVDPAS